MRVLWLAWRDYKHPERGGAEVVLKELLHRQVAEGHNVTLLTAAYPSAPQHETLDGIEVIRIGHNRYAHPLQALWYYLRHLRGRYDVVIETVNTAPYFSLLFRGKSKGLALYHQLARDVWFFETKPPLSHVGYYFLEPLATWVLGRARAPLVTVSESTKHDLAKFGWRTDRTHIISEGLHIEPLQKLGTVQKFARPTVLSHGSLRPMKRTLDQVKAFEFAKLRMPELQMKISGDASGDYGREVLEYIQRSPFKEDIEYVGRVSDEQKRELMQRAHVITVTSVKEGWGLIVTEAASQGTPAVVYDADGLRDSVRDEQTGLVTAPTPEALARGVVKLLGNPKLYAKLQKNAWQWSQEITFDKSYEDLKQVMEAYA